MSRTTWANPAPAGLANPYAGLIRGDHPLAYWRMGDGAGSSVAVDQINGNNGTVSGAVAFAQAGTLAGDSSTSAFFDGASSLSVGKPDLLMNLFRSFDSDFSLEAWVKPVAVTNFIFIAGPVNGGPSGDQFLHLGFSGGVMKFGFFGDDQNGVAAVPPGVWSHVVYTWKATSRQRGLYLNGGLDIATTATGWLSTPRIATDSTIEICRALFAPGNGPFFFNGNVEEMALYGYALDPSQILRHYQAGLTAPIPAAYQRAGNLFRDVIFVDSSVAPLVSPAPAPGSAGNLAGIVPQGWVQQIGNDGEVDTMAAVTIGAQLTRQANIYQWLIPYDGWAAWPPDPQRGQPGHTAQRPTGEG